MKLRIRSAIASVSALLTLAAPAPAHAGELNGKQWSPPAPSYGVAVEQDLAVKMKDGTVLRADVHYPADPVTGAPAEGPFPVILSQTPYTRLLTTGGGGGGLSGLNEYLIRRGYIQVIADVRGTGDSGGSFGLLQPVEASDGVTLVRWAAELPRSNGRVGLFGESYLAMNQLLTASAVGRRSPLKAIFPIDAGNNIYRDLVAEGGLLKPLFLAVFVGGTGFAHAVNPIAQGTDNPDLVPVLTQHLGGLFSTQIGLSMKVLGGGAEAYDEAYWRTRRPQRWLAKVVANRIPAFLVGGWRDLFQRGEPLNYAGLQNAFSGRPVSAPMRRRQRASGRYHLLMGSHAHFASPDVNPIALRWFDTWLKRKPTGIADSRRPLHLNVLGTDRYLDLARYPLEGVRPVTYYLGPDGTLSATKPDRAGGSDELRFTGASSPCGLSIEQWSGGLVSLALGEQNPCTSDDSTTQLGPGASSYTTAPFRRPTMVAGPIGATLLADATTAETVWVATVEDVAPSGRSRPLTSGALLGSLRVLDRDRSWYARGRSGPRRGRPVLPYHPLTRRSQAPVVPGELTRYEIEIRPTFAELASGHRLRLTISTSEVPLMTPLPHQLPGLLGGVYRLHHRQGTASSVTLPLAPAAAFKRPCSLCQDLGP